VLEPPVRVRPTHTDDAEITVDVALLERKQLRRSEPGRGCEHDHRPVDGTEPLGGRLDLLPRFERPLLLRAAKLVRDAPFRRVGVEQPPGDRAAEHLPKRLGLEAMPLGNRQTPCVHVPWRELRQPPFLITAA
jgi:hypothetical protein